MGLATLPDEHLRSRCPPIEPYRRVMSGEDKAAVDRWMTIDMNATPSHLDRQLHPFGLGSAGTLLELLVRDECLSSLSSRRLPLGHRGQSMGCE